MKTVNVLMIYPKSPRTYWTFDYVLPYGGWKALLPPLGLMTVAAMLPERYRSKIVDMNVSPLRESDIVASDLVFLSAMTSQQESFNEVVRLCNRHGKRVVAGGPYAWTAHELIEGVDHFFLFEAENTLPAFVEDYESGRLQSIYSDPERPDIKRSPTPRFDLIEHQAYMAMPVQFSRGCPHNCEFCDIIEMFGRKVRTKSPQQVIDELDSILRLGFAGEIFIVDDNFIGNRAAVKRVLRRIVDWQRANGYPYALYTEATIDLAQDEELLDLMVEAGFTKVFIGIESPDPAALRVMQKKVNLRSDLLQCVRAIQSKGIMVMGGFIVGLDSDTEEIFDAQFEFVQQAGIASAMTGVLAAVPQTRMYRRLEKEGRVLKEVMHSGDNVGLSLNYVPRMPVETLIDGYRGLLQRLYTPRNYYDRCMTLMKDSPRVEGANQVRMFPKNMTWRRKARSLLGVSRLVMKQLFSPYGMDYLRFLAEAGRVRRELGIPRSFHTNAVVEATKGYQYFMTTRRILSGQGG